MKNPLLLPEIIETVMDHIDTIPDLLNCACINNLWNICALKRLYKGSLNDMRYRTPDIGSLNCLFVASRKRFVQNTSFVKHLLLHPEKPLTMDAESGFARIVSGEPCRALRHRRYAEALLRPGGTGSVGGGGGLLSLTIPFWILNMNRTSICDLLISPGLEFLAINDHYCSRVISGCIGTSETSVNPELLKERLSHLKALTIYHCGGMKSHHPHDMVACCDLEYFHFEDWKRYPLLSSDITKILTSLKTHNNLKVLALRTNLSRRESIAGTIASAEGWAKAWPNLKALYLWQVDQNRLNEIEKFKQLEILSLNDDRAYHTDHDLYSIAGIATCQNLRVLDIWLRRFDTQEIVLQIAQSCPLLRRLSVECAHATYSYYATSNNNILLSFLRILPHIEYLSLDWSFYLVGDWLQELAVNCPNLTVLRLRYSRLFISLAQLKTTNTFKRLEILNIRRILFENTKSLMEGPEFPVLASEWRRVFPRIRAVPCFDDIDGFELEKTYQDKVRAGIIEEKPIRGERPYCDDSEEEHDMEEGYSDSQSEGDYGGSGIGEYRHRSYDILIRLKLWEKLNYERDKTIYDRLSSKWQADFEIENIGWPVVPLKAFGSENII